MHVKSIIKITLASAVSGFLSCMPPSTETVINSPCISSAAEFGKYTDRAAGVGSEQPDLVDQIKCPLPEKYPIFEASSVIDFFVTFLRLFTAFEME
jgi:hypothetical protein